MAREQRADEKLSAYALSEEESQRLGDQSSDASFLGRGGGGGTTTSEPPGREIVTGPSRVQSVRASSTDDARNEEPPTTTSDPPGMELPE